MTRAPAGVAWTGVPGSYLARAQVTRGGKPAGLLTRPFVVLPRDPAASTEDFRVPIEMIASVPPFDPKLALRLEIVGAMLDLVERARPSLKDALAASPFVLTD
jgi:hypothetical protein